MGEDDDPPAAVATDARSKREGESRRSARAAAARIGRQNEAGLVFTDPPTTTSAQTEICAVAGLAVSGGLMRYARAGIRQGPVSALLGETNPQQSVVRERLLAAQNGSARHDQRDARIDREVSELQIAVRNEVE